jgi:ABC-2 type transport system ATP-binding protein
LKKQPIQLTTQRYSVLRIENLTISYRKNEPILQDLELQLEAGQVHGLVGINGSGKTTLLKAISGEVGIDAGSIWWGGQPISDQQVALLETSNYFYPYLTGGEYLQVFKAYHPKFEIESLNQIFQLPLEQLVENYSTGMKKKLAFLAMLSLDRPLLILDEPFNGLDIEGTFAFRKLIEMLKEKGKTILITSHIFETLTTICDQIHYLSTKKIAKSYPKTAFEDLKNDIFHVLDQQNSKAWENLKNII